MQEKQCLKYIATFPYLRDPTQQACQPLPVLFRYFRSLLLLLLIVNVTVGVNERPLRRTTRFGKQTNSNVYRRLYPLIFSLQKLPTHLTSIDVVSCKSKTQLKARAQYNNIRSAAQSYTQVRLASRERIGVEI